MVWAKCYFTKWDSLISYSKHQKICFYRAFCVLPWYSTSVMQLALSFKLILALLNSQWQQTEIRISSQKSSPERQGCKEGSPLPPTPPCLMSGMNASRCLGQCRCFEGWGCKAFVDFERYRGGGGVTKEKLVCTKKAGGLNFHKLP